MNQYQYHNNYTNYGIKQIILIFYLKIFKVTLNIQMKINNCYKVYFKNKKKFQNKNNYKTMVLMYKNMKYKNKMKIKQIKNKMKIK